MARSGMAFFAAPFSPCKLTPTIGLRFIAATASISRPKRPATTLSFSFRIWLLIKMAFRDPFGQVPLLVGFPAGSRISIAIALIAISIFSDLDPRLDIRARISAERPRRSSSGSALFRFSLANRFGWCALRTPKFHGVRNGPEVVAADHALARSNAAPLNRDNALARLDQPRQTVNLVRIPTTIAESAGELFDLILRQVR